ncbi:MAG: hypothetical protein JST04_07455 [Bdellovibrionales bacterium]|nr:hypothetical protein [Bdellovibrionales bacterium]
MIRRTLYVVPETPKEVREEFRREAARRGVRFLFESGEYFLAEENAPDLAWATDIAWEAYEVDAASITAAAKNLKQTAHDLGKKSTRWLRLEGLHHRRAALVAENLATGEAPSLSYRRGANRPDSLRPSEGKPALAGFFLLSPERALAVFDSLTPYPGGSAPFAEEKHGPPSRAYLKLWEICARLERAGLGIPKPGETALDLGSCPGGWTWALAELGARVASFDGAPLDPAVAKRPEVAYEKADAFRLVPRAADWFFSDMICEPKRLPELLARWRDAGCARFAVSVKFKGEADEAALARLREIPGARLRHLRQNKHELTWFLAPDLKRI